MTSTFADRPINGDVSHYADEPKQQDDPQVLLDALDKLLAVPGVESVRWTQYTPYFDDGEACVFHPYDAYVKVAGSDDEGESGDGYLGEYDLFDYTNGYDSPKVFGEFGGHPGEPIYAALKEFEDVLTNGRHYVVLSQKFGDPAEVTATTAGFDVEYYEHD